MNVRTALALASLLVASSTLGCVAEVDSEEPEEEVDTQEEALAPSCVSLGSNWYCEGGALIINFDSLCTENEAQWVETKQYVMYFPGNNCGAT